MGQQTTKLNCSITDVFQQGNLVLFGCHKRYVKLGLYTNIGIFFEILRNVLSQSICVFRRDYLNSESQDKKKVPFDMTGWKTASPKVLCHILFAFVFVSPSDCFNTFPLELLTILSFSLFTFFRIYRSNWTAAIAAFSLARYDLPQSKGASLIFFFSQPCCFWVFLRGYVHSYSD